MIIFVPFVLLVRLFIGALLFAPVLVTAALLLAGVAMLFK